MNKITPFLWFDNQAEEAMKFYISVFKNSKIIGTNPGPDGKVMMATFELEGQRIMALNGGPEFKLNESFSFVIDCADQAEVDEYWSKLTADGGSESQCGWLKDKFGLSWQVIPTVLGELLGNPNQTKAQRVMQAMLQMKKLDIAALEQARDQE